jgi:hypothetical protein
MEKAPEIRIEQVLPTKNDQVLQLELRKEHAVTTQDGSLINLSLGGRVKKYVDRFPVDINFLEAYGYDYDPVNLTIKGDNLFNNHLKRVKDVEISTMPGQLFPDNFPVVDLFITESFNPSWDGHEPKKNPSTGEVMCKDGKPIYWNCEAKQAEHEESFDTFVQADGSSQAGVAPDALVNMMSKELAD